MKILLGADQYPEYINGAATFTSRLAEGLAAAGHTVDLLWPSAEGPHATYLDGAVRVHRLSTLALPGRPRMQVCPPWSVTAQIDQVLEITRPDVVHVQSHLTLGRALVRRARAAGVPVMATNHFMPENLLHHVPLLRRFPDLVGRLAWRDLQQVYADADLLSAPTQRAVDLLAAATTLPQAEVISCGVDLYRFRRPSTSRRNGRNVLFVGRLEQEKHVDELLRAFALLPAGLGAELEIVGMGSMRASLTALSHALGTEQSVRFTGAVSDEELLRRYRQADLFVMPGTAELQSLATLEAMASGLPVVAADAMALPHLVRDGENGYRYSPGRPDHLAERMQRLLTDADLRCRMGRASAAIAGRHDLGDTVQRFLTCYARLTGGGAAAPASGKDQIGVGEREVFPLEKCEIRIISSSNS